MSLARSTMDGQLVLVFIVAAVIILWLWSRTSSLSAEVNKQQAEVGRQQAEVTRLSRRIQDEARAQFQKWRQDEYEVVKKHEAQVAEQVAQVKLAEWKANSEAGIRADAIQRSQSVIVGKVTEHI